MTERWEGIPGWEHYEVSSLGRVRSLARSWIKANGVRITIATNVLKGWIGDGGYPRVSLHDSSGVSRQRHVHSLVALAFLGPRPEGQEVRHLNDVSDDNRLENIAYGTSRQNKLDMVANGGNANRQKTECPSGHPYSGDNLIKKSGGRRDCRECQRAANRRYRQRKKEPK